MHGRNFTQRRHCLNQRSTAFIFPISFGMMRASRSSAQSVDMHLTSECLCEQWLLNLYWVNDIIVDYITQYIGDSDIPISLC